MKKRDIPQKNYIIVAFLSIFTLLGAFCLKQIYNNGKNLKEEKSALMEVAFVLNSEEFLNYIQENGDILLYYGKHYSKLEEDFAFYIREKGLKNVVYVENNDGEKFLRSLEEYSKDDTFLFSNLEATSFLFLFSESKIFDFLEILPTTTIDQIQIFLEKNKDVL